MALPKFLQTCLWSYDISKMDTENPDDKELIIQQVLNYGGLKQLKWLYKTYKKKDLIEVVKSPRRGMWLAKSLNYWTKILDIKLPEIIYETAIFSLHPRPKLMERYFQYMENIKPKRSS